MDPFARAVALFGGWALLDTTVSRLVSSHRTWPPSAETDEAPNSRQPPFLSDMGRQIMPISSSASQRQRQEPGQYREAGLSLSRRSSVRRSVPKSLANASSNPAAQTILSAIRAAS